VLKASDGVVACLDTHFAAFVNNEQFIYHCCFMEKFSGCDAVMNSQNVAPFDVCPIHYTYSYVCLYVPVPVAARSTAARLLRSWVRILHPQHAVLRLMPEQYRTNESTRHEQKKKKKKKKIPMVSEFFIDNPSGRTMALGSTQPLTEMSTRTVSWG
jgi:hypothetical protein